MAVPNLLRPILLTAARSSRVEHTIAKFSMTRGVVERFVAGTTEADVVHAIGAILQTGRYVTIDYLGEDTTRPEQADNTVAHYLALLSGLSQSFDGAYLPAALGTSAVRPVEVSLKLSALGQSLPADGHQIALENARKICMAAQEAGVWVTIDAEDHTTTDSTLSIVAELRKDFPDLGTVLQAYLRRTEDDCKQLSGPGSRIRLCKGAYHEPASVAHQGKAAVDAAYLRCLKVLMNGQGYPMVATHDPEMIAAAIRPTQSVTPRSHDDFELQMLYGIRETEQLRLISEEHQHLRVYVPYGDQWYGYFMRRLAERPANIAFFLRSMTTTK
jgi:proline dehydrogenase